MKGEDNFTSTVDGAAGFERMRVGRHREIPEDYAGDDCEIDRDDSDNEPECNCSDPGCPCGGRKIGGV